MTKKKRTPPPTRQRRGRLRISEDDKPQSASKWDLFAHQPISAVRMECERFIEDLTVITKAGAAPAEHQVQLQRTLDTLRQCLELCNTRHPKPPPPPYYYRRKT